MSELTESVPEIVQFDYAALKKLMQEIKSNDYTVAMFERDKTARIVALCDLLKALPQGQGSIDGGECPATVIMRNLQNAISSYYYPGYPV